jgi:hypothetical protein
MSIGEKYGKGKEKKGRGNFEGKKVEREKIKKPLS